MDSMPDLTLGPGKLPVLREQMKRNREGGEGMGTRTRSERAKREDMFSIKASFPFLLPLATSKRHHKQTRTVCRFV